MIKLLTMAMALIVLSTGVTFAQSPDKEGIAQMCLAEASQIGQLVKNPQQYCSCIGQRLDRHVSKLEHMDGARVRKQVMDDLRPCFDDHMKPAIQSACNEMNIKLSTSGEKMKLDCGCYYNNMLETFSAAWAGNLTNQSLSEEQQKALIEQGVIRCAKATR
jgi:hypothetical protein